MGGVCGTIVVIRLLLTMHKCSGHFGCTWVLASIQS